ncbi:MAG: sigma-70 family RNA polymerase sigma factor, partial [Gemmataceae bacterium]|nr:sigma-70 family RNA polymerase sigma factor [Gemmataceae bacterium]
MPARSQTHLLHRFCTLVATHTAAEVPDRELVERFTRQRDESAFEVLLRRHGPMVWRLCRRVLRHEQDAEDAFQATFVVLARKAPSLRRQEAVGAWLYGVARRIALKARARDARRRERESLVPERSPLDPLDEISVREAQTVLDEELLRLPARYQAAVLLCCLEGLTRDEAAARIGVSVSTLKSRLEEGRRRLRERLARRGLSLSAVLASALLGAPVSAALP